MTIITAKECQALLDRGDYKNYKLISHELKPFCESVRGYLGEHWCLTLNYEDVSTLKKSSMTYFVKTRSETGLFACLLDIDFFAKEAFAFEFVRKVKSSIKELDVSMMPKLESYTASKVIMEDLSVQGYKGPENLQLNRLEVLKMLEAVAKFHTVSIVYQELQTKRLGRKFEIPEEYSPELLHTFFANYDCSGYRFTKTAERASLALIKEVYKDDPALDEILKKVPESFKDFLDLINEPNDYYKVLNHADLWSFNSLFKYSQDNQEPIDCKLVDFQLVRYAPPAHDVTMFLYCVTTEKVRQKYLQQFYQHYHQTLKNQLKIYGIKIEDVLPLEDFLDTCRRYMCASKLIWLVYRQLSTVRPEVFEKVHKDVELYKSIITGDQRTQYVMDNYKNDPVYKEKITIILKMFIDHLKYDHIFVEDVFQVMSNKLKRDYKLIEYTLKMSDTVIGFMGSHAYLTVRTADDVYDFFVKMVPTGVAQIAFSSQTWASIKEMKFYGAIVPEMLEMGLGEIKDVIAECYLSNKKLLVFDNLSEKYQIAKSREHMKFGDVQKGLLCLSKLHASAMIYDRKLKQRTGKGLSDLYKEEFSKTFYSDHIEMPKNLLESYKLGIATLIDLFFSQMNIPVSKLNQLACEFIDEYSDNTKPSKKFPNTICHGDLWAANIMLSESDAKCIDFQSYRYSPPTQDVTQFIYLSMHRKDRLKHLPELLEYYYENFRKVFDNHGFNVDDFMPYNQFLESVEVDKKFAAMQSISHFQTTLLSPEGIELFFSTDESSNESLFGDRRGMVAYNCKTDEVYRDRLRDAMQDFYEICEQCLHIDKYVDLSFSLLSLNA